MFILIEGQVKKDVADRTARGGRSHRCYGSSSVHVRRGRRHWLSRPPSGKAEALFARLVERFATDPAVTPPSVDKGGKFGASGLKVDGKLFAMVSKGKLVVKLPRPRVDELVASGSGEPFDP